MSKTLIPLLIICVSIVSLLVCTCSKQSWYRFLRHPQGEIEDTDITSSEIDELAVAFDSVKFSEGTFTQESFEVKFNHIVDVPDYIPLRNRPIEPKALVGSNEGTPEAKDFNEKTILKYLFAGEQVQLIESVGKYFHVSAVDYQGEVHGYILKEIGGQATLKRVNGFTYQIDRIEPFCNTLLSKKFVECLNRSSGSGMEKFFEAIDDTHHELLLYKVFLGSSRRQRVPSQKIGGDFSKYIDERFNDHYIYCIENSSQTFLVGDQPPDLIRNYRVNGDTLEADLIEWRWSEKPEISTIRLYPKDKLVPESKVWVLNDSVELIDVSDHEFVAMSPSDVDLYYCLRILDNYLLSEIGQRRGGYVQNYLISPSN